MSSTGAGTRVDVTLKLAQLQDFCKRDPAGYQDDYEAQVRRLESELKILALQQTSQEPSPRLIELIQFTAAVSSSSYKGTESDRIANILIGMLLGPTDPVSSTPAQVGSKRTNPERSKTTPFIFNSTMPALMLHRDVRKSCVSALILMRNKGVLDPLRLMELFFRVMAVVPDKILRELLYKHLLNDIRNINKKGKRDETVNRSVQTFLHRVVATQGSVSSRGSADEDEAATDIAAKRATDLVCELYRRRVWTEDRTVAILASAVLSPNTTVMCRAMRFFLNIEEKMAADVEKQLEEEVNRSTEIDYHRFSKKTAARERHVQQQLKRKKKVLTKKASIEGGEDWVDSVQGDKGVETSKKLYPAIELLRDPQGLAEAVFKRLRSGASSYKYEVKLLMINFITRLVGNHELMLLQLYPFLQKYLGGHQRDVTAVLAYTVQACHENVPPDEVFGILKTIAHNFITERCSEEQMAVGINAARAICSRVPSVLVIEEAENSATVMDIEAFARDLAAFANHRDRSVSIAGKSWTNFIRATHPALLQGKDRGIKGSALYRAGIKPLRYGEKKVSMGVEGADLLFEYESKKAAIQRTSREDDDKDVVSDDEISVDEDCSNEPDDTDDADADEEEEEEEEMDDQDGESSDVGEEEDGEGEWNDVDDGNEEAELNQDGVDADNDDDEVDDGDDDFSGTDDEAPMLVNLGEQNDGNPTIPDVSRMTPKERDKLKQEVSANRIFTASDFVKMRKLLDRERRAKEDPREAARRKRAIAKGAAFEELSDDSDESDDDEENTIRIPGAVNPGDIVAEAKKKRQSKAEKLAKIIAGRKEFESKKREGGSTNTEKRRRKNFVMSKYSFNTRMKGQEKGSVGGKKRFKKQQMGHLAKKRRRKL